jgi:hypothetical protein
VKWWFRRKKQAPDAAVAPDALTPDDQPDGDETPTGQIPALGPADFEAVDDLPEPGSYPNSVKSLPDGSAPTTDFTIKGNAGSMLYHTKESPYYGRIKAEVWFRTPEDAEAAGFTCWNKCRSATSAS